MDVFSEAKQKGKIRAHGCSCQAIEALRAAAKSPWVEVDLARLNPIGSYMDADPQTVLGGDAEMKARAKRMVGMKVLGQGDRLRGRMRRSNMRCRWEYWMRSRLGRRARRSRRI